MGGGLLNLINFNQGSMAKKVVKSKRPGGLEAPRNSLELPIETSQSYVTAGDCESYTYQMKLDCSKRNHHQTGAPMKKLISEEISKKSNKKRSAPSIVARLMGVDVLPLDTKHAVQQVEKISKKCHGNCQKEDRTKNASISHASFTSNLSRHRKSSSYDVKTDKDRDLWFGSMDSKTRPREHPQEKELQKFKKEFEAWQAARFKECSKFVETDCNIRSQYFAEEILNKDKMVFYENSRRTTRTESHGGLKTHALKESAHERLHSEHPSCRNEITAPLEASLHRRDALQKPVCGSNLSPVGQKESYSVRNRSSSMDFEEKTHMINSVPKKDVSSCHTKIVILRPGPDRIGSDEDSWVSSAGSSEERGSIEDFLEEVKERLKCELHGKPFKKGTMIRGGGIETPYHEKPSDPKQIAQCIAKQVSDSVTRDLGMNLHRSESTRSYRSETQFVGTCSPEFISRDTRRFLSERLKNVLKNETHQNSPVTVSGSCSSSSVSENEKNRIEESAEDLNAGNKVVYSENLKGKHGMQSRSFRRGIDDELTLTKELSPRNLIRSLSAPVSGTSFGKLLLEDRHVLTGAHIRRKHEAIEKVTLNVRKGKKEKFNLMEKVSSFKYSFTLKGKLFRRKIQSVEELHGRKNDFSEDIMSGPTVKMNFNDRLENSTEVPPSPASVCSSAHEELWRPAECLSPIGTPDIPSLEDDSMPLVFREISSNLRELRKQINLLENGNSEQIVNESSSEPETVELENQTEAYIRDLLVASGFYDGLSAKSLSRWETRAKPISRQVFEEVELSYRGRTKNDERFLKDKYEEVDHKVLFDLLNEALLTVLRPPATMSRLMRNALGYTMQQPHGKKLLNLVWDIIAGHLHSLSGKSNYLLDTMVAKDIRSTSWCELLDEDVNGLGKDVECQIFGDLMEEIVSEMQQTNDKYEGDIPICCDS